MKSGDELAHFYFAQAEYLQQKSWETYRGTLFDHLQKTQNKDGSWPSGKVSIDTVYVTALWCTILQLDVNTHPTMQRKSPASAASNAGKNFGR
jgi:hypothetical protein